MCEHSRAIRKLRQFSHPYYLLILPYIPRNSNNRCKVSWLITDREKNPLWACSVPLFKRANLHTSVPFPQSWSQFSREIPENQSHSRTWGFFLQFLCFIHPNFRRPKLRWILVRVKKTERIELDEAFSVLSSSVNLLACRSKSRTWFLKNGVYFGQKDVTNKTRPMNSIAIHLFEVEVQNFLCSLGVFAKAITWEIVKIRLFSNRRIERKLLLLCGEVQLFERRSAWLKLRLFLLMKLPFAWNSLPSLTKLILLFSFALKLLRCHSKRGASFTKVEDFLVSPHYAGLSSFYAYFLVHSCISSTLHSKSHYHFFVLFSIFVHFSRFWSDIQMTLHDFSYFLTVPLFQSDLPDSIIHQESPPFIFTFPSPHPQLLHSLFT